MLINLYLSNSVCQKTVTVYAIGDWNYYCIRHKMVCRKEQAVNCICGKCSDPCPGHPFSATSGYSRQHSKDNRAVLPQESAAGICGRKISDRQIPQYCTINGCFRHGSGHKRECAPEWSTPDICGRYRPFPPRQAGEETELQQ